MLAWLKYLLPLAPITGSMMLLWLFLKIEKYRNEKNDKSDRGYSKDKKPNN